jgi:hypothetical protein
VMAIAVVPLIGINRRIIEASSSGRSGERRRQPANSPELRPPRPPRPNHHQDQNATTSLKTSGSQTSNCGRKPINFSVPHLVQSKVWAHQESCPRPLAPEERGI